MTLTDSEIANLAELTKEKVGIKSSNETSLLGEICLLFHILCTMNDLLIDKVISRTFIGVENMLKLFSSFFSFFLSPGWF